MLRKWIRCERVPPQVARCTPRIPSISAPRRSASSASFSGGAGGSVLLEHNAMLPVLGGDFSGSSVWSAKDGHALSSASPTAAADGSMRLAMKEKQAAEQRCATRIVATIGPACDNVEVLSRMIQEGMNVARLNFSHGSHDEHRRRLEAVRAAADACGVRETLAVALDTKGPEIRTLPNAPGAGTISYMNDTEVSLHLVGGESGEGAAAEAGYSMPGNDSGNIYIAYPPCTALRPGSTVLLADGSMELRITALERAVRVDDQDAAAVLRATVVCGCALSGRNNAHFPGVEVQLPALSDTDVSDIRFGVAQLGVDMIFASFARSAAHIEDIRRVVDAAASKVGACASAEPEEKAVARGRRRRQGRWIPIIAKIESVEGIVNLDEIVAAADGIMIARGDLGMDIPLDRMFMAQKMMAARCNLSAKPVICATQLLESMTTNPRPTRAEATDVANAVLDGVDCVMLSGETAKGRFPVEAVRMLRKIAHVAESTVPLRSRYGEVSIALSRKQQEQQQEGAGEQAEVDTCAIADAAVLAAFEVGARFIVTTTITGDSVRALARLRPPCPVVALCYSKASCRSLALTRGVIPVFLPSHELHSQRITAHGDVAGGEQTLVSAATPDVWATSFERLIAFAVERVLRPLAAAESRRAGRADQSSCHIRQSTTIVVTNTDPQQLSAAIDCHATMSVRHVML